MISVLNDINILSPVKISCHPPKISATYPTPILVIVSLFHTPLPRLAADIIYRQYLMNGPTLLERGKGGGVVVEGRGFSGVHNIFVKPDLRLKPSPVNTKFPDLKPRLSCK